ASSPARVPPQALNPRVVRELVQLVERGLAVDPHARGCARELAQAADSAALHAGPEADVPLFEVKAAAKAPEASPAPVSAGPSPRPMAAKVAVVAATAFTVVALCQAGGEPHGHAQEVAWVDVQDKEE